MIDLLVDCCIALHYPNGRRGWFGRKKAQVVFFLVLLDLGRDGFHHVVWTKNFLLGCHCIWNQQSAAAVSRNDGPSVVPCEEKTCRIRFSLECGVVREAHLHDIVLGTTFVDHHLVLLGDFLEVWQEEQLQIKLEKCEFPRKEIG